MRRICTQLAALIMALALILGMSPAVAEQESGMEFDEGNIVLSFAALSDIHQTGRESSYAGQQFLTALEILSRNRMDAFVVAGDLTETGAEAEAEQFAGTYAKFFDGVPLIYAMGNHDGQDGSGAQMFIDAFDSSVFAADVDESAIVAGNRHAVVNGFHFVCVETMEYYGGEENCLFSEDTLAWLEETLAEIDAEDPDKPIFVIVHPMVGGTVYGSDEPNTEEWGGLAWYTTQLTDILKQYPQVITFSGHTHTMINDEKSIMQTDFTSVGCGSVYYMAADASYAPLSSGGNAGDGDETSQGLYVEVDGENRVRITRLDFWRDGVIKQPWIIDAPAEDGSHLQRYTMARAKNNEAPDMSGSLVMVWQNPSEDQWSAGMKFTTGTDDELIHHYELTLVENGQELSTVWISSEFYLVLQPEQMRKTFSYDLGLLKPETEYEIHLVAVDSWNARSEDMVYTFTTGSIEA